MGSIAPNSALVGTESTVRSWSPQQLIPALAGEFSGPIRKRAERTLLQVIQRVREYDDLAAEHGSKQNEYDHNERILMALPGGANARSFEATEMRRRQDALDTELQGIETRLAGLARVLGWPS